MKSIFHKEAILICFYCGTVTALSFGIFWLLQNYAGTMFGVALIAVSAICAFAALWYMYQPTFRLVFPRRWARQEIARMKGELHELQSELQKAMNAGLLEADLERLQEQYSEALKWDDYCEAFSTGGGSTLGPASAPPLKAYIEKVRQAQSIPERISRLEETILELGERIAV